MIDERDAYTFTINFPMQILVTQRPRGLRGLLWRAYWTVANRLFDLRCRLRGDDV